MKDVIKQLVIVIQVGTHCAYLRRLSQLCTLFPLELIKRVSDINLRLHFFFKIIVPSHYHLIVIHLGRDAEFSIFCLFVCWFFFTSRWITILFWSIFNKIDDIYFYKYEMHFKRLKA